jgi:transposase
MDNARIHHGEEIVELVDQYGKSSPWSSSGLAAKDSFSISGVHLVFLPPYSLDLNPIEEAFSKIKAWICCNRGRSHV